MNVKNNNNRILVLVLLVWLAPPLCWGQKVARKLVRSGNTEYQAGNYNEALNLYEQALTDDPKAYQARFNQSNAYYQLEDLEKALTGFREVAADSKDMGLVAKAKYNIGNTYFKQGLKHMDGDLQKAMQSMKNGIDSWRSTLEINEEHPHAARNIEVARLMIKDIIDQINKQQDPNQPQDPNQSNQQDQQQQQQQQQNQDQQQQDQQQAGQDPNQPQDPNEGQSPPQDPNEGQDPNQAEPQPEESQQEPEQQEPKQDMTAQEILDKEQRQKEERRQHQRTRYRPVDKDW